MPRADITVEEWLQAVKDIEAEPGEGHTVRDLCELWDLSERPCRRRVRQGLEKGWIRRTMIRREQISGYVKKVPAYVLLKPEVE